MTEETIAQDEAKPTGPDLSQGIPLDQFADGKMLVGHFGEEDVLLVRRGHDIYAVGANCTHYHGPLTKDLWSAIRCGVLGSEKFGPNELTAAHPTLPFGTRLRVTNVANGRSVSVRINDRGPFVAGRSVDVSYSAAERIGISLTTPSGAPISDNIDWIDRFVNAFGSPNLAYGTEICNWHKDHAHACTLGRSIASPDFDNTGCVVLWGHNPSATWLDHGTAIRSAACRLCCPRRSMAAGTAR
jgi:hypothetical protein